MKRLVLPLALGLVLASAAPVRAGVVIESTDKGPGDSAPARSRALVGADRVRVEADGRVMIWRADKQVLWVLDPAERSYLELTKQGMGAMADAMKQAQAAMADLPPEQRAMVESMMRQRGGAPAAPKEPLAWTVNGTADSVGGRACVGYDGKRSGKLERTICSAPLAALGFAESDFDALRQLAEFMKGLAGPMAQHQVQGLPDADVPGLPVRMVIKESGGDQVHEVVRLETAAVEPSQFEVPAGYAKQSMDEMAGGGAGHRGRR